MRLLGKLYLNPANGDLYIHSKSDGRFYRVKKDYSGWDETYVMRPLKHWRLIGDSYAKD